MKREFKDLVKFEHYENLNSEIKGNYDKAQDQNVLDIAGPGDLRIKKGLLSEQYKAVLPLLGYYQFMDNYFTPHYLLDIIAARGQK